MSSQRTANRLEEFCLWYDEHQRETSSVEMRVKFLEKALDETKAIMSYLLEDIHELEGRPPEALGRRVWTPNGMSLKGSLQRFG